MLHKSKIEPEHVDLSLMRTQTILICVLVPDPCWKMIFWFFMCIHDSFMLFRKYVQWTNLCVREQSVHFWLCSCVSSQLSEPVSCQYPGFYVRSLIAGPSPSLPLSCRRLVGKKCTLKMNHFTPVGPTSCCISLVAPMIGFSWKWMETCIREDLTNFILGKWTVLISRYNLCILIQVSVTLLSKLWTNYVIKDVTCLKIGSPSNRLSKPKLYCKSREN